MALTLKSFKTSVNYYKYVQVFCCASGQTFLYWSRPHPWYVHLSECCPIVFWLFSYDSTVCVHEFSQASAIFLFCIISWHSTVRIAVLRACHCVYVCGMAYFVSVVVTAQWGPLFLRQILIDKPWFPVPCAFNTGRGVFKHIWCVSYRICRWEWDTLYHNI